MKTKGKLTLIVGIIGAVLSLTAAFLAWNTIATYRLVDSVTPALELLTTLNEIQSKLHRQQHALAHFVISGEPASRQALITFRGEIDNTLQRLAEMAARLPARRDKRQEAVVADSNLLRAGYRLYLEKLESCLRAQKAGDSEAALRILDNEVTPYWEEELLVIPSRMAREESAEIRDIYREITLKLGALPWVAGSGLRQVTQASSGVDYEFAVSNTELGLHRQVNELSEFLLHAETQDWQEFWGHRFEMRRLFEDWHQVILRQRAMGIDGEDEDEKRFAGILAQYEALLPRMEQAVTIRVSLGRTAGLEYVEHHLMAPMDDQLFPALEGIGDDSREEIRALHEGLLRTVVAGSFAGLSAIVVFSILVVWLVSRMSNGIVNSLARLKEGTEVIKGGNLEHQITMPGGDEFSELAAAFNAMSLSLKEHNDELRSFVFSVAHDLRAPLVNLKGFSSELRSDLAAVMPVLLAASNSLAAEERGRVAAVLQQAVPEALGYIDSSANKLDALINAVLQLSRIDFRALDPELVDSEALAQATLLTFAHTLKEKNITVSLGPLPAVVADRLLLEQCFANLVDNACKYQVPGRIGELSLTAEQTGDEVIFYFMDNGRGIAPDDIPKVFEIFRRVGAPDTPGEGMGLAFTKALVRLQGGRIWCESVLGEGSTFCLALPGGGAPDRSA